MDFGACTDIGSRKNNQDYYYKSNNQALYIIADGMGGHKAGEVASQLSTGIIADYLEMNLSSDLDREGIESSLKKSVEKANELVYSKSLEKDEFKGMGTTISLGYIDEGYLYIAHVGDSSVFLFSKNTIKKITKDHSLVEELLKDGSITEEEARNHPQKNIITRAVGTESYIEVDIYREDISEDDIIIFCTDGLTNMVTEEEMERAIENNDDLNELCRNLVEQAKNRGGHDNITMMAVRI